MSDSTHYSADLNTIPHRLRRMFTMQRFELQFPLKRPKYVIENVDYQTRLYKINAWNHPWIKVQYSIEELWLCIRYAQFSRIWTSFKRRLKKWCGLYKHS